jgi:hypothetical protein
MRPPRGGLESLGYGRTRSLVSLDEDRVERMAHQTVCVAVPNIRCSSEAGRFVAQPTKHAAMRRPLQDFSGQGHRSLSRTIEIGA